MLIRKKKFIAIVLDLKHETFVVHIAASSINLDNKIYSL